MSETTITEQAAPEAVALFVCYEVLKDLDTDAARRVTDYLRQRFFSDQAMAELAADMERATKALWAAREGLNTIGISREAILAFERKALAAEAPLP